MITSPAHDILQPTALLFHPSSQYIAPNPSPQTRDIMVETAVLQGVVETTAFQGVVETLGNLEWSKPLHPAGRNPSRSKPKKGEWGKGE